MTERSIDLHLLQCFDALIVEGSVTLAADRLQMSQPGMSNALSRLRQLFDDPILVRTSKGMALTDRARALAPAVRASIDQLNSLIAGPETFDPSKSSAVIRIAATDGTITCALEPVISAIQASAPMMRIEITPLVHGRVQEPLETGIIDLAFGLYADLSPTLYSSKVVEDQLCCIIGRDSNLAMKELTLDLYKNADHAIISRSSGYRSTIETIVDAVLEQQGIKRKERFIAPYATVLAVMVARSNMLATMNSLAATMYAAWLPIVVRPLPFESPPLPFTMVWHERMADNAALTWVRQMVRCGMLTRPRVIQEGG